MSSIQSQSDCEDAISVTQDNELIEASYTLTLNEKRLLLLGMSKIDPTHFPKSTDKPLSFDLTVDEWKARFPQDDTPWRAMKRAADRMMTRSVTLHPKTGVTHKLAWFDSVHYYEGESRLTVQFARSITIRLQGVIQQFTKLNLLQVAKLNSFHSIRLYELLSQFRRAGFRRISLEDFKRAMDCADSYPMTKELKRWVLNPALKELAQKADFEVECRDLKRGRRIVGFEFILREREQGDLFRDQVDPADISEGEFIPAKKQNQSKKTRARKPKHDHTDRMATVTKLTTPSCETGQRRAE